MYGDIAVSEILRSVIFSIRLAFGFDPGSPISTTVKVLEPIAKRFCTNKAHADFIAYSVASHTPTA